MKDKKVWVSALIPESLKEQMKEAADKKRWSMNIFIEVAIAEKLASKK